MRKTKEQKSKHKIPNTNNGITLIALIITIIVMLILVAVTINMAVNGGLFSFAGRATAETQNAINKEQSIADGAIKIGDVYYTIGEYLEQVTENDGNRLKLTYTITPAEDNLSAVITVNARMLGGLLEGYEEYRTWALKKLEGKTEEEIEQIFVDGQNYWNKVDDFGEPIYANIEELVAYWSENYCDGRFDDVEGMVDDYGYDTLVDFAIDWQYVYPEEYEYWDYFDYWAFARKELQGKTEEEIEQIFVDGQNYWNEENDNGEPVYANIEELVEYWIENWPDYYEGCEDIYDIVALEGYDTLVDMAIDWGNVYPEKWDEHEGKLYDNIIHIMDPNGETWWETNTVEYTVYRNGEYTFKATNETGTENNIITVKIDSFSTLVVEPENIDDWIYEVEEDGTITITGYKGSDTEVIIPNSINGIPVKKITGGLFESLWSYEICTNERYDGHTQPVAYKYKQNTITSVIVSEGIEIIGYCCFTGSLALEEISLPASLMEIGNYVFSGCSSLINVTIPENVSTVGSSIFYDAQNTIINVPWREDEKPEGWKDNWCGETKITINYVQ